MITVVRLVYYRSMQKNTECCIKTLPSLVATSLDDGVNFLHAIFMFSSCVTGNSVARCPGSFVGGPKQFPSVGLHCCDTKLDLSTFSRVPHCNFNCTYLERASIFNVVYRFRYDLIKRYKFRKKILMQKFFMGISCTIDVLLYRSF
jgi:hypothetical protein